MAACCSTGAFPKSSQMWMRNTLVPLDMVFINPDGTIRSIAEDTMPRSLAAIDSRGPVRAMLELRGRHDGEAGHPRGRYGEAADFR